MAKNIKLKHLPGTTLMITDGYGTFAGAEEGAIVRVTNVYAEELYEGSELDMSDVSVEIVIDFTIDMEK